MQEPSLPLPILQEIQSDYEKLITIPPSAGGRKFILCPVGLLGAGKTTVVRPLSEKLSFVRISGDEIRKLFREGLYPYQQSDLWHIAVSLIRKYLSLGYSVAIDSDCSDKETMIEMLKKEFDTEAIWLHINPPEEFIINKLRNFKHSWLFKNADQAIEIYHSRKHLHQNLKMPFTYVFDTSKDDLHDQIDLSLKIIKSKM